MTSNITFEKFYTEYLKPNKGSFGLLAGNGLGLSNPHIKHLFEFDQKEIKKALKKDFENEYLLENFSGPEDMLEFFLNDLICKSALHYIKLLKKNEQIIKYHTQSLISFLTLFSNIFTLNYDDLLYKSILSEKEGFYDGFSGTGKENTIRKSCFEDTIAKSSNKKGLFNIHGAFRLFRDFKGENVFKASTKDSLIEDFYKEYHSEWKKHRNSKSDIKNIPLIIMATRSRFKKSLVDKNFYLELCLKRLCEEKNLFIFGCSLEKDMYIIDELNSKEDSKNIYISYYHHGDKEKIDQKISEQFCDKEQRFKFYFVNCGGNQEYHVWEKIWGLPITRKESVEMPF